jgi:hypothetical protein
MWIAKRAEQSDRSLESEFEWAVRAGKQVLERLLVSRIHVARWKRERRRGGAQDAAHPVAAGRPDMWRSS